ncbi:MAG: C69 family dipeptidase [candidate division NC10 bacterium]|nr:C69 family dipeptidase [candidate division NC10 bacterium]
MRKAVSLFFVLALFYLLAGTGSVGYACDTMVALPDATTTGTTILGKNSDRPIYDCQPLMFNPRAKHAPGETLKLEYVEIPQVAETYATIGSSPYWCWGYEEGINEFGVAIGNEAIFTKTFTKGVAECKVGQEPSRGLLGMDLLRLGLERGKTAREALEVITKLVEKYGQWGSGVPCVGDIQGGYDNILYHRRCQGGLGPGDGGKALDRQAVQQRRNLYLQ